MWRRIWVWNFLFFINNIDWIVLKNEVAHHDDKEVEQSPKVGKVLPEAESNNLQGHLSAERRGEENVEVVKEIGEVRLLVKIDVLEAQRHARRHDQSHNERFEDPVLHEGQASSPDHHDPFRRAESTTFRPVIRGNYLRHATPYPFFTILLLKVFFVDRGI